jgi:endonuclease/exonuclease/phosphatase family protein
LNTLDFSILVLYMDNYFTIAFYNLENLFDTVDNKYTHDDDFLPTSEKHWTPRRYKKKIRKLGYTISKIGFKTSGKLPVIVGLAEVENKLVVNDLLHSKFLKSSNYGLVHYDSSDERGIDVALIYNKDVFKVEASEIFSTNFFEYNPNRHSFSKANVFDNAFLKQFKGKYRDTPFRTYVGLKYKGGYSDHFPVYIHLMKKM